MTTHNTGFVYVMQNPAMPGMVKIGFTRNLPEERAQDLYHGRTGVPLPFDVAFRALTMRWPAVERLAHQRLAEQRVSTQREFFRLTVDEAVEAVRECILDINGVDAWPADTIHPVGEKDRVVLALEADDVFVLLSQPSPLDGRWQPLDLWQAHSDGDQLEIYAADGPEEVAGFSDGDTGGEDDPVPHLDRKREVANGILNGKERLAPGDRILWLRDGADAASCTAVIFEAREYCQVASRTWSPQWAVQGFPLILNALVRDPSQAMLAKAQAACDLKGPRSWGPRSEVREDPVLPLPGPERWLPQLKARKRSRRPGPRPDRP